MAQIDRKSMIENRKNGRVTLPGVVVTMGSGLPLRAPRSSSLSKAEGVALPVALRYSRPEELTHKHRFYISSATTQLALKCKCTFAMFHMKDTTDFVPPRIVIWLTFQKTILICTNSNVTITTMI